jgi:anthranilate phosphoribosyltransferase
VDSIFSEEMMEKVPKLAQLKMAVLDEEKEEKEMVLMKVVMMLCLNGEVTENRKVDVVALE